VVGIHGASDAMRSSAWYGDCLLGARFKDHPSPSVGRTLLTNPSHPVTLQTFIDLNHSNEWSRLDEWYTWDRDPRNNPVIASSLQVLGTAEDAPDHQALIWTHMCGRSRVVYTSLGHYSDAYTNDSPFEALIESAIAYVAP
jgi:type 1 glutamine amidotransferase